MVGMVVVAACSSYFSVTSYRGDMSKTVEVINGKIKEHKPMRNNKDNVSIQILFIMVLFMYFWHFMLYNH